MNTAPKHAFIDFAAQLHADNFSIQYSGRIINHQFLYYALWHATESQGRLRKKDYQQLQSATVAWHERVYLALQRMAVLLTQYKKTDIQAMVMEELQYAEVVEQYLLAQALKHLRSLTRTPQQQLSDACHNLVGYYKFLQVALPSEDEVVVLLLLCQTFPAFSEENIRREWVSAQNAIKLIPLSVEQLPLEEL